MRRRITLAILGTVAAALIFAGLGTLALNRVGARNTAAKDLRQQAEATSAILNLRPRGTNRQKVVQLRDALNLKDVDLVILDAQNQPRTDLGDPIPPGVVLTSEDYDALRAGQIVTGSRPTEVWAAVPLSDTTGTNTQLMGVLFLTRNTAQPIGSGVGWFILASMATLAAGRRDRGPAQPSPDQAPDRRHRRPPPGSPMATCRSGCPSTTPARPTSSTPWPGPSTRWPTPWSGHAAWSASSCCRCPTTCAPP